MYCYAFPQTDLLSQSSGTSVYFVCTWIKRKRKTLLQRVHYKRNTVFSLTVSRLTRVHHHIWKGRCDVDGCNVTVAGSNTCPAAYITWSGMSSSFLAYHPSSFYHVHASNYSTSMEMLQHDWTASFPTDCHAGKVISSVIHARKRASRERRRREKMKLLHPSWNRERGEPNRIVIFMGFWKGGKMSSRPVRSTLLLVWALFSPGLANTKPWPELCWAESCRGTHSSRF